MKVFISYAREDKETAFKLYTDLKDRGVDVWIDFDKLLPGQNWKHVITKAIKESNYFILILSSKSVSKKGFIQNELKVALDLLDNFSSEDIFIIPVRIDDCNPVDERISELHSADLFISYENGLNEICNTIFKDDNSKFSKYLIDGNLVLENIDLKFFEGAWHHRLEDTTYYARVIDRNLHVTYCFNQNPWQQAHFYDIRLIYDKLIYKFKWFDKSFSGVGYKKVESLNQLVGGWWHNKHLPKEVIEDISRINDDIPKMFKQVLKRKEDGRVPFWAEDYFKSCKT